MSLVFGVIYNGMSFFILPLILLIKIGQPNKPIKMQNILVFYTIKEEFFIGLYS